MTCRTCHFMTSCHAMLSCHVMSSRWRLTLVCVHVNIHPPMSKTRIPASVQSVNFNVPTTHLSDMSVSSKSGANTPKSDQTKCHAPFSALKHVGGDMSNMSFHDNMSCHVLLNMSCHVVTLETDLCVCPCQYSPTHVKDQNPCLCVKCQFQCFR